MEKIIPRPLQAALVVRSFSLLLPKTFFSPDEFYQSLEPAHHLVFGYGHLTWEWRDLPKSVGSGWWNDTVVVGGRMRGWLWPSVFAGVYQALNVLGLDGTALHVCLGPFTSTVSHMGRIALREIHLGVRSSANRRSPCSSYRLLYLPTTRQSLGSWLFRWSSMYPLFEPYSNSDLSSSFFPSPPSFTPTFYPGHYRTPQKLCSPPWRSSTSRYLHQLLPCPSWSVLISSSQDRTEKRQYPQTTASRSTRKLKGQRRWCGISREVKSIAP